MTSTPIHGHGPIKMRRVSEDHNAEPGDFWWKVLEDGRRYLMVALPIPNSVRAIVTPFSIGFKNISGAAWRWDGNLERPTLEPSLHAVGHWHGWVRNGELIEAR